MACRLCLHGAAVGAAYPQGVLRALLAWASRRKRRVLEHAAQWRKALRAARAHLLLRIALQRFS